MDKLQKIISDLKLAPHPEGGFYRETYRNETLISSLHDGTLFTDAKSCSTCIYFLLTTDMFSAFHKLHQDEIWHFYDGLPVTLHMIDRKGQYSIVLIGRDLEKGEVPQYVITGGTYFAASVPGRQGYSLVGCTVSPGFDFKDLVLPGREELINKFPQHSEIISRLTRI